MLCNSGYYYLVLAQLLLVLSVDANRDENEDAPIYPDYPDDHANRDENETPPEYPDVPSDDKKIGEVLAVLNQTKTELLSCCNKTKTDTLGSIQDLSEHIQPKLEDLAHKTDVEILKGKLTLLANKSESAINNLQGTVDELPTKDTIQNYTQHIKEKFTTLVENLENNVTELAQSAKIQISNKTLGLKQMLDHIINIKFGDLELDSQKNAEVLVNKLNTLLTFEDIKNLTELVGNLATKEGINATKNSLSLTISEVQNNVDELKKHLMQLVNKTDIENITNLVESLATKESLESIQDELNSLSKEDTVKNLTHFVSNQIANKKDVQKTKEQITISTSELMTELSTLKDKFSNLAVNNDIQKLNKKVLGIDEKMETSKQNISDLKDMLQKLQSKQDEQNNKINKLIENIGKASSSQEVKQVEQLIKSLQVTSDTTLLAVKNITNAKYSPPNIEPDQSTAMNCMDSSLFTEQIDGLKNKVENKCSIDNMKEELEGMEDRLQTRLENITGLSEKKSCTDAPTTEGPKPQAGSCEDTVFVNLPHDLDVCTSVVTKHLCDTDPLIAFHCCFSCVFSKQIASDGPHRYVNAPRKVDYSAALHTILSGSRKKNQG